MSKNHVKNQLKSISSNFLEEANKISSITDMIDEGWKGQNANKYLMGLEDFIKQLKRISTDIDVVIYEMDKDIQTNSYTKVEATDIEKL
ncbi:MAG TPA: hypothetical protein GXZ21_04905 [Clostridiales bacterium]|nr:hypothetical protein [Clostridiales bacterium]